MRPSSPPIEIGGSPRSCISLYIPGFQRPHRGKEKGIMGKYGNPSQDQLEKKSFTNLSLPLFQETLTPVLIMLL